MLRSLIRIGFARGIGGSRGWLAVGMTVIQHLPPAK
jgi:hypothetical protein